ncbi:hypothetical protein [Massilia sp. CF038]|uniref:hypothetical protein n=1 Tax=Massilia sp. CF038 TaxID=1881045 RepID=UPI0009208CB6|nr:hypothetical protein [Massilia sp. CF038]SHH21675.1 hypothetical protein SAMN05428948_3359 [Massilia sp. CF038]
MKTTLHRLSAVLIAAALSTTASVTLAQSAKPAAKSAKAGKDKLQTKEELRACMLLREDNLARAADLEKRNEESLKKKALLAQSPETGVAAAKAEVEVKLAEVRAADALVKENSEAVASWNERMADFEKNSKDMRNADRRRQVLKDERYALKAKDEKLVADRALKVTAYEASVAAANEKIANGGRAAEEWNKNNDALADEQDRLSDARDKWHAECANRRFIDTDEAEIKKEMKARK